jgi:hypothetical protein
VRARNLKPALFKNDQLGTSDPLHALIYAGLWCYADREGRMEDRPPRIHAEVNPYRALTSTMQALDWLCAEGFIRRYVVDGSAYIDIPKFSKHQNPHVREARSSLPSYEDSLLHQEDVEAPGKAVHSTVQGSDQHQSGPADSGFLTSDSPILNPVNGSPHVDSRTPPSPAAKMRQPAAASVGVTEDQVKKAIEERKKPKHAKFSDHDIAMVAGVPVEAARIARQREQPSQGPRRAMR